MGNYQPSPIGPVSDQVVTGEMVAAVNNGALAKPVLTISEDRRMNAQPLRYPSPAGLPEQVDRHAIPPSDWAVRPRAAADTDSRKQCEK
jgi:hypothetical protein